MRGGEFVQTSDGGAPSLNKIASWNGTTWAPLGEGFSNTVKTLAVYNNVLYAGGKFSTSGGGPDPFPRIASWDGTIWSNLDANTLDNDVNAIALQGSLPYIGGNFIQAGFGGGATILGRITYWNGSWQQMPAGSPQSGLAGAVNAIAIGADSDVYIGGDFTATADPGPPALLLNRITRWDGTAFNTVGAGLTDTINALAWDGTNLYAGGAFGAVSGGGKTLNLIGYWDGTSWNDFDSGLGSSGNGGAVAVYALAVKVPRLSIVAVGEVYPSNLKRVQNER